MKNELPIVARNFLNISWYVSSDRLELLFLIFSVDTVTKLLKKCIVARNAAFWLIQAVPELLS